MNSSVTFGANAEQLVEAGSIQNGDLAAQTLNGGLNDAFCRMRP